MTVTFYKYDVAKPFPHAVIDDFLPRDLVLAAARGIRTEQGESHPMVRNLLTRLKGHTVDDLVEFVVGSGPWSRFLSRTISFGNGEFFAPCDFPPTTVRLICFINDEWIDDWGGLVELWGNTRIEKFVRPRLGRILIVDPGGRHGVFSPLKCPEGVKSYWYEACYAPPSSDRIPPERPALSAGVTA